jgi:hypothetical protein
MQEFVQVTPHNYAWTIVGTPTATSVAPAQALAVLYASDGSYDTLPALTPAVVPGGGTTFDRRAQVWILYTVKGSGVLSAVPEAQLGGLASDYAPLARVLHDTVVSYQPQQPSGAPDVSGAWTGGAVYGSARAISGGGYYGQFASQSIRGGGYYGQFLSQSIQGGGSVSGISATITSSNDGNHAVNFGTFVKLATLPGSDRSLFDYNIGTNGYFRAKITNAGHVILESVFHAVSLTLDLTPTTPLQTATWYWVAGAWGNSSPVTHISMMGQVIKGDGTSADGGQATQSTASNVGATTYTGTLGWGVHLSSSYADFPVEAGTELSKLQFSNSGYGYPSPPASDGSPVGLLALYLCRQAVGTVTGTLPDSTSNHYDLTPGANGMAVVADGPYP